MASTISAGTTSGTAIAIAGDTTGALALQTNGTTTAVTLDTSQNATFAGNVLGTSGTFQVGVNTTGKDARFGVLSGGNGRVEFYSAGAEAMRISSGALLINETSTAQAPLLQITGSTSNFNNLVIKDTGTSYGTGNRLVMFLNSSDSIAGVISHSGATAVTYGTSSDARLKENIVDAPNALDKVMDIKIRSYDWKEDKSHVEYGLVAQELNSTYSEPVGVGGEDVKSDPWNIEYGRLTPILLKAIQELKAQVNAQSTTIADLTTRLIALENK